MLLCVFEKELKCYIINLIINKFIFIFTMRKLDFLSNSPKTFIFEKSSNKTTFGGSLTLIYIFIVFLIVSKD